MPQSGFVYINGTSSAGLASGGAPYEGRFRIGVDAVGGTASSDRWVNVTTDGGDGTDEAVVTSLLTSVGAGAHTFYFSDDRRSIAVHATIDMTDPPCRLSKIVNPLLGLFRFLRDAVHQQGGFGNLPRDLVC